MRILWKPLLSLLICLGLLLGLAACTDPVSRPTPSVGTPQPSNPSDPTYDVSPDVSPTVEPSVEPPEPPADQPTTEPTGGLPVIEIPTYQFGTPLAETEPVEDTHFDNAAFLGDSRTEGLQLFGGLYHGDFFWARGMTVFRVDDPAYAIFEVDGELVTMIGALRKKTYDSIYIMVGINELGYDAATYEEGLSKFIDKVLEVQPNAVVYLQTLPPVNEEMARKNGLGDYINNTRVNLFNEAIVRIAAEKKVVLLDTAEAYRDENGILPAELASDGCHFNFNGYTRWTDYLRTHVMDAGTYYFNRWTAPVESPAQPTEEVPEA